jgi:hypothetical protein
MPKANTTNAAVTSDDSADNAADVLDEAALDEGQDEAEFEGEFNEVDDELDWGGAKPQTSEGPPTGFYRAEIETCSIPVKPGNAEGKSPYILFVWLLLDDDFEGKKQYQRAYLTPAAAGYTRATVDTIRGEPSPDRLPSGWTDMIIGKQMRLKIVRKPDNQGEMRSEVRGVYPLTGSGSTTAGQTAASSAPRARMLQGPASDEEE